MMFRNRKSVASQGGELSGKTSDKPKFVSPDWC
jgi:hypothetical protein